MSSTMTAWKLMKEQKQETSSPWNHTCVKPMSANEAFIGRKVKSNKYRKYESHLIRHLPDIDIPEGHLELRVVVYYSSRASDIDNCLKPFIDILQKRYGFNDNRIYRIRITKVIVKKGEENIAFRILPFESNGETTYGNQTEAN